MFYLAPQADPRVSIKARLGTEDAGSLTLRYQPWVVTAPLCFLDVKANPRVSGAASYQAAAPNPRPFCAPPQPGSFATRPRRHAQQAWHAACAWGAGAGARDPPPSLPLGGYCQRWLCTTPPAD